MKIHTYCKFVDEHLEKTMYLGMSVKTQKKTLFLTSSYLNAYKFKTERKLREFMAAWEHLMFEFIEARDWQPFNIGL